MTEVTIQGLGNAKEQSNEPQKRPVGAAAAAVSVLATAMNSNQIGEAGAIKQMNAQDMWIDLYTKELETVEDSSDAVNKTSDAGEGTYKNLQVDMNVLTNQENGAQQQLDITTTLGLRNAETSNQVLAYDGKAFIQSFDSYSKTNTN